MKQTQIIFFCALLCLTKTLPAQDTLKICRNYFSVDLLGNSFTDHNVASRGAVDAGVYSISYTRKCIFNKSAFLFSVGIGPFVSEGYDAVKNQTYPLMILNFPAGFLWRKQYKRNGFWGGLFVTTAVGRIVNSTTAAPYYTVHSGSFQISPNLTYQFQSKNEHFFCRFNFTPKILAATFSENYGIEHRVLIWGGISIGGGW